MYWLQKCTKRTVTSRQIRRVGWHVLAVLAIASGVAADRSDRQDVYVCHDKRCVPRPLSSSQKHVRATARMSSHHIATRRRLSIRPPIRARASFLVASQGRRRRAPVDFPLPWARDASGSARLTMTMFSISGQHAYDTATASLLLMGHKRRDGRYLLSFIIFYILVTPSRVFSAIAHSTYAIATLLTIL